MNRREKRSTTIFWDRISGQQGVAVMEEEKKHCLTLHVALRYSLEVSLASVAS